MHPTMTTPVSPETLTDRQIREALEALPAGHYSQQWYLDALGSEDHPTRRANARRIVCDAINDSAAREADDLRAQVTP